MKIKSVLKAFHEVILEISENAANQLIQKKEKYACEEKHLFIVKLDNNQCIAIDNTTGECFVETFRNKNDAYIWLLGLKEAEPLKAAEEKLKEWY